MQAGRCQVHARDLEHRRLSSNARGYDRKWYKFRAWYLVTVWVKDPFCQDCRGEVEDLSEVELHHKIKLSERPDLKYDLANIRHLCSTCHSKRTIRGE